MKEEGILFESYLERVHGIDVEIDESGWEAITMYHDEIDHNLIPKSELNNLPDPLLLLTTSYDSSDGQEWIFCLATENEDASKWLYAICLRNEKLFDSWIP